MIEKVFSINTWVIIRDTKKLIFAGEILAGQTVSTGKPFVEEFVSMEAMNSRLLELNFPISN